MRHLKQREQQWECQTPDPAWDTSLEEETEGCIEGNQAKEDESQTPRTMAEMVESEDKSVGKHDAEGGGGQGQSTKGLNHALVLCLIVNALGIP